MQYQLKKLKGLQHTSIRKIKTLEGQPIGLVGILSDLIKNDIITPQGNYKPDNYITIIDGNVNEFKTLEELNKYLALYPR